MSDLVEVTADLRGATAPADHRYVLYAALKERCCRRLTERGWQVRAIQAGRHRGPLLSFDESDCTPQLRLRAPKGDLESVLALTEEPLRLGDHLLLVDEPTVSPVRPSNTLESDLVVICNQNRARYGYSPANLGAKLGARLGAWFGRCDFGVAVGDRHGFQIKGYDYYGHPVKVTSLTDEESLFLQRHGLGARQTMGCGTFWPCEDGLGFEGDQG